MKRLVIAMIFGLGLAICLIGLVAAPACASPPNEAQQIIRFDATNINLAPMAIDTGPGVMDFTSSAIATAGNFSGETAIATAAYIDTNVDNFSGTVVFAQHSTTYVDTGQMPIDTTAPVAMKIDVKDANTHSARPNQPDHPVFDNALAKRYGEQAMLQLRPKSGTSGGGFLRT